MDRVKVYGVTVLDEIVVGDYKEFHEFCYPISEIHRVSSCDEKRELVTTHKVPIQEVVDYHKVLDERGRPKLDFNGKVLVEAEYSYFVHSPELSRVVGDVTIMREKITTLQDEISSKNGELWAKETTIKGMVKAKEIKEYKIKVVKDAPWYTRLKWLFTGVQF